MCFVAENAAEMAMHAAMLVNIEDALVAAT